jgi:hypothetical protein
MSYGRVMAVYILVSLLFPNCLRLGQMAEYLAAGNDGQQHL